MPATKPTPLTKVLMTCAWAFVVTYLIYIDQAHSAELRLKDKAYSHYAQKEDIKDVLTDFFAAQGVGVVCSESVGGAVSGNFSKEDPLTFFNHITNAYNLIWYYDGATVYVYSAHEMTSQVVNLGYLDMLRFKQNLIDLDILDPKFALRMAAKERIVFVAGPQRYVELVAQLAEELDAKAMAQRGRDDIVRVFKLNYAWADDKTIVFRDREMSIPGVATLIQDLITGNTAPGQVDIPQKQRLSAQVRKLKGSGLSRGRPKDDGQTTATAAAIVGPPALASPPAAESEPNTPPPSYIDTDQGFVQADTRQNAIVVRDREEKMPYYQGIIDLLDVPVGLVEIKATIMDIDRNNIEDLGIEWEFGARGDDGRQIAKGGLNTTTPYSPTEGLQLPVGAGLNLATVIGSASDYFLSKVYALQEKGHAKILSRPSVLTLNNIEAQLEHSKTFYVRVEGNEEVDLFDINTGVVLRVTPHIIEEGQQSMVKLSIQIEDGEIIDQQVDNIPIVKKSVINTQAVVGEEESLLIGGYFKERNAKTRQTVPCLGEVPLLGWLFSRQSTQGEETERLFLITPTIKPYGVNNKMAKRDNRMDQLPQDHATRSILDPETNGSPD
jgi:type III secretion protein C